MKDLSDVLEFTKESKDIVESQLIIKNRRSDELSWRTGIFMRLMDSLNVIVNAIQEIQSNQQAVVGDKE